MTNSKSASSAGIKILNVPRPDSIKKILADEGIDISKKPKTKLKKEKLSKFDKVYVLCEKEKCPRYKS